MSAASRAALKESFEQTGGLIATDQVPNAMLGPLTQADCIRRLQQSMFDNLGEILEFDQPLVITLSKDNDLTTDSTIFALKVGSGVISVTR